MSTKTEIIDLSPFRDAENDRYDFARQFTQNGWRYATDGRIAVRVPDRRKNSRGKFPNMNRVFTVDVDFYVCRRALPECVGPVCDCYGGLCTRTKTLKVQGRRFCPHYVALIRALPDVMIGRPLKTVTGYALPFAADGGLQGLLMEVGKE